MPAFKLGTLLPLTPTGHYRQPRVTVPIRRQ